MLLWISCWIAPGLLVRELNAITQYHHAVCTENTSRLFHVSPGFIHEAGIPVIDSESCG
jgi:hypothetical protein